jgi:hypothetical protein
MSECPAAPAGEPMATAAGGSPGRAGPVSLRPPRAPLWPALPRPSRPLRPRAGHRPPRPLGGLRGHRDVLTAHLLAGILRALLDDLLGPQLSCGSCGGPGGSRSSSRSSNSAAFSRSRVELSSASTTARRNARRSAVAIRLRLDLPLLRLDQLLDARPRQPCRPGGSRVRRQAEELEPLRELRAQQPPLGDELP